MADDREPEHQAASADAPQRRPYTSPRLIEYGSVAKLTRGSKSISSDFPQAGFQKKSCL